MEFSPYFLLWYVRSLGFTLFLPGGKGVFPYSARFLLAFVLSISLQVSSETSVFREPGQNPLYLLQVIGEFFVGALQALPLVLTVDVAKQWAELIERGRGLQLGASYQGLDTEIGSSPPPLSICIEYLAICSLILSGMFLLQLAGLSNDLHSKMLGKDGVSFGYHLLGCLKVSLITAFRWFLPFGIIFIICDLSIGIVAKLVPGVPVYAESFVVKSILTFILMLFLYLPQQEMIFQHFYNELNSVFPKREVANVHR